MKGAQINTIRNRRGRKHRFGINVQENTIERKNTKW